MIEAENVETPEYVTVSLNEEFVENTAFDATVLRDGDIRDYDFILDGTDNFPAKFLINDACVMAAKPFSQAGVIGAMGGVIGSMQAMEAIKYITGAGELLTGSLLTYDALKMEFHKIKLPKPNGKCPVCGDAPTITHLIDYEQAACDGVL